MSVPFWSEGVRADGMSTALEALVATLRKHLSRLTSELSSHQQLLGELRTLRDSDAKTLREKSAEVERLREEVEKLAGEVEVLKGVVEEGLNERRTVREASTQVEVQVEPTEREQVQEKTEEEDDTPLIPPRANVDRTMRTDHATLGSSNLTGTPSSPFIDKEELHRISFELEERRSDRSRASLSRSREVSDVDSYLVRGNRAPSPSTIAHGPRTSSDTSRTHDIASHPAAPTPAHASQSTSCRRSRCNVNQSLYRHPSRKFREATSSNCSSPRQNIMPRHVPCVIVGLDLDHPLGFRGGRSRI